MPLSQPARSAATAPAAPGEPAARAARRLRARGGFVEAAFGADLGALAALVLAAVPGAVFAAFAFGVVPEVFAPFELPAAPGVAFAAFAPLAEFPFGAFAPDVAPAGVFDVPPALPVDDELAFGRGEASASALAGRRGTPDERGGRGASGCIAPPHSPGKHDGGGPTAAPVMFRLVRP
ncbi:MAG: hypothetical protein ACJ72B_01885 [Ornithinibacter sp.]